MATKKRKKSTSQTPEERHQALRSACVSCRLCKLHKSRKKSVFGVGDINAKIAFIGEGPGADENAKGVPFVGKAGKLLDKMIEAMGLTRDDVYITNVVKCRPPKNRNPQPWEAKVCTSSFMNEEIRLIRPHIMVTLGKIASNVVLERKLEKPLNKVRGKWHNVEGIWVMPTFHPAYLLRNAGDKKIAWKDLKKVMARFQGTV